MGMKQLIKKGARQIVLPAAALPLKKERMAVTDETCQKALSTLHAFRPDLHSSAVTQRKTRAETYDLGIIVPAYNAEQYIQECVDSVLSQKTTYTFRMIVIDDGSRDHTFDLLEKYQDERLIVLRQSNKGPSAARNQGLSQLEGRYVLFLDADDILPPNAIDTMLRTAYETGADLVTGKIVRCNAQGEETEVIFPGKTGDLEITELVGYPWGKVIRSSWFERVCFPDGYWFEDSIMRQLIHPLCQKRIGITEPVYRYRWNPTGITRGGKANPRCVDSLYITMQLFEDRKAFSLEVDQDYYEYIVKMAKLHATRASQLPDEIQRAIFCVFAYFVQRQFSGWHSNLNPELDYALKNGCYMLYRLCSRL